ncbi:MAG: hypothetical protein WCP97_00030 [bacterium]
MPKARKQLINAVVTVFTILFITTVLIHVIRDRFTLRPTTTLSTLTTKQVSQGLFRVTFYDYGVESPYVQLLDSTGTIVKDKLSYQERAVVDGYRDEHKRTLFLVPNDLSGSLQIEEYVDGAFVVLPKPDGVTTFSNPFIKESPDGMFVFAVFGDQLGVFHPYIFDRRSQHWDKGVNERDVVKFGDCIWCFWAAEGGHLLVVDTSMQMQELSENIPYSEDENNGTSTLTTSPEKAQLEVYDPVDKKISLIPREKCIATPVSIEEHPDPSMVVNPEYMNADYLSAPTGKEGKYLEIKQPFIGRASISMYNKGTSEREELLHWWNVFGSGVGHVTTEPVFDAEKVLLVTESSCFLLDPATRGLALLSGTGDGQRNKRHQVSCLWLGDL